MTFSRPLSALAHDVRHGQTRPSRSRADFLLQLIWHHQRVRLRHIRSLYRPQLLASPLSEQLTSHINEICLHDPAFCHFPLGGARVFVVQDLNANAE